jgi:hypothetical protein
VAKATAKIGELGLLNFFPADKHARAALVGLICEDLARSNDQIDWLVRWCLNLWSKWEGPKELRAVFCSKFKPADGIECYSDLPQFLDGIPSEKETAPLSLGAAPQRQIASTGPVSAAPSIAVTVSDLATAKDLNRVIRSQPRVRDIPERLVATGERITAADIERAVQELRNRRAAAEIEVEPVSA